jgi:hypothetical protein
MIIKFQRGDLVQLVYTEDLLPNESAETDLCLVLNNKFIQLGMFAGEVCCDIYNITKGRRESINEFYLKKAGDR